MIIGNSPKIKKLSSLIERISPHDTPVLITGEPGVGKELVAKAIHYTRNSHPFICLSCASSEQFQFDIELFGIEQGVFPGANGHRKGCFETADKGIVFLDGISRIGPTTQVKLLRFLEHGEVERLGSHQPIPLDVGVIAATSDDLTAAVNKGTFREDLYYRRK